MKFAHPFCLWLIPIIWVGGFALAKLAHRVARRKIASFGPPERQPRILNSVNFRAKTWKFSLVVAALSLLALVAARPMVGPRSQDSEQSGAEFFIVLDVSKSMLVRDLPPNRLEAVKTALTEWLKTRHGDRIGLILMAGDAFVQAPLTNDYTALREVLGQSGPLSMSRGGTNIAGAIQIASTAFSKIEVRNKTIVIITDGENLEGNASEAARLAHTNDQITIFTVGVGSEEGGPVPEVSRSPNEDYSKPPRVYVKDEYGVQAQSRLDERMLRTIATAGGGRYYKFTKESDVFSTLYTQSLKPLARRMELVDLKDYDDVYQIPLLLALLLLAWEMALSTRLKNPPRPKSAVILPEEGSAPAATKMKPTKRNPAPVATLLLVVALMIQSATAATDLLSIGEAEKLFKDGKTEEAAKSLWSAAQKNPDDPYLLFNYGIAAYASGKFNEAIHAFSEVSASRDEKLRALALTHLGNSQYRLGKTLRKANNGEGAIIAWERAYEDYDSLLKEKRDRTASHNIEITREDLEKAYLEVGGQALDKGRATTDLAQRVAVLTGAFEKFEKATVLVPTNAEAIVKLEEARHLLSDSLRDQARAIRDQAVKTVDTPKDKGKTKEKLNLAANENYARATEVDPKNSDLKQEHEEFKKSIANDFADVAEAAITEALVQEEPKKGGLDGKLANKQKQLAGAIENTDKALAFDENNARAKDLKAKALEELEKAFVERGDMMKAKADQSAAMEGAKSRPDGASRQYESAMEDYQKALEIKPDNAQTKEKLAEVQSKLAAQLAKSAGEEIKKAESALASTQTPPPSPTEGTPAKPEPTSAETAKLKEGIGHLEKAVPTLAKAEALAPGKNNAAEMQKKASEQLDGLRNQLNDALAKAEAGQAKEGAPGESGQGGEGGEGGEGQPTEPKDGNQMVGSRFGGGKAPLNFSEIRGSSEQEGQFVDKTKKESFRDW